MGLEEIILNEADIDHKISFIREIVKALFNFGVLKINKKKSILNEFDNIRKDICKSPILIIQSKLALLFNSIAKGRFLITLEDSIILGWSRYVNEKWLLKEYSNEKLVKIVELVNDQCIASKPLDKINIFFQNELNKSSIKISKIESLLNDIKDRSELIKVFYKKLNNYIIISSSTIKNLVTTNKTYLPKITKLPVLQKNINNFLHSNITNEFDSKSSSKNDLNNKIFIVHSNREKSNIKELQSNSSLVQDNILSRSTSMVDQISVKKVEQKPTTIKYGSNDINKRYI